MPVLVIKHDLFDVVIMVSPFNPATLAIMLLDEDDEQVCPAIYIPLSALRQFLEVVHAQR